MDANELTRAIRAIASDGDHRALVGRLRASTDPAGVLSKVAREHNRDLRDWVVGAARDVLDTAAAPILLSLVDDRDPDISNDAMVNFASLGIPIPKRFVRRLRAKLRSSDFFAPVTAMWVAAQLGIVDLIPEVERVARAPAFPWHATDALVALEMLQGNGEQLLTRLRQHDHNSTQALVRAAYRIGTPEARDAVAICAEQATDEGCRRVCSQALLEFKPDSGQRRSRNSGAV